MNNFNETVQFNVEKINEIQNILLDVWSIKEKGYNPVNQIVGYICLRSTYITSYNNARSMIRKLEKMGLEAS